MSCRHDSVARVRRPKLNRSVCQPNRRDQRVPADVALPLVSRAVPRGAIHLHGELHVLVGGVEHESLTSDDDRVLLDERRHARRPEDVQTAPDLQLALAAVGEQRCQPGQLRPPGQPRDPGQLDAQLTHGALPPSHGGDDRGTDVGTAQRERLPPRVDDRALDRGDGEPVDAAAFVEDPGRTVQRHPRRSAGAPGHVDGDVDRAGRMLDQAPQGQRGDVAGHCLAAVEGRGHLGAPSPCRRRDCEHPWPQPHELALRDPGADGPGADAGQQLRNGDPTGRADDTGHLDRHPDRLLCPERVRVPHATSVDDDLTLCGDRQESRPDLPVGAHRGPSGDPRNARRPAPSVGTGRRERVGT